MLTAACTAICRCHDYVRRAEGVQDPSTSSLSANFNRFVIMQMKPLDEEAQRRAIERQMRDHPEGRKFSVHLMVSDGA